MSIELVLLPDMFFALDHYCGLIYMHVCMYLHIYTRTHVCTRTHTHSYINSDIHTYSQNRILYVYAIRLFKIHAKFKICSIIKLISLHFQKFTTF